MSSTTSVTDVLNLDQVGKGGERRGKAGKVWEVVMSKGYLSRQRPLHPSPAPPAKELLNP